MAVDKAIYFYREGTNSPVYDNVEISSASVAAEQKVREWLGSIFSAASAHKAGIVLGATLLGTNATTGIHRFGAVGEALSTAVAFIGSVSEGASNLLLGSAATQAAYTEINAIYDELKNPNIEGIPIHADVELETQDADVQQHLLIQQTVQNKKYAADNVVPKPRTWNIQGYLMSSPNLGVDSHLIIKPSLLMQRSLLQRYMDSRMPVVFKSHDNRFFTVLITHFDAQYTVQSLNSLKVNINLVEFNTMSIDAEAVAISKKILSVQE